jgi:hypothetical protein
MRSKGIEPFKGRDGVRVCLCSAAEFQRGVASSPTPINPARSMLDGSIKYGEAGDRVAD